MEKLNPGLIDEINILNKISDNEYIILFKLAHFAEELGIKQKYMTIKIIKNTINKTKTEFKSESIDLNSEEIIYYNLQKLDKLECHFANLVISFGDNININYLFKIINNDTPIYMENLIGLIMKKIFYNIKQFINTL